MQPRQQPLHDDGVAVFRKEFLHIFRDAGTLRLALALPVMQLVLFGFIDQSIHDLPTAIVDQDRSVESRLFQSKLAASRTFKIVAVTSSPDQARQMIRAGTSQWSFRRASATTACAAIGRRCWC